MRFGLLGWLEVVDGGRDAAPRRRKQRALLALLLLRAGEMVTVDEALDALWGVRPPPTARNAVQGHVATLRKLLGRDRIATRESGYTLRLEEDELDLHLFERLLSDARGRPPREQAELLAEALGLFAVPRSRTSATTTSRAPRLRASKSCGSAPSSSRSTRNSRSGATTMSSPSLSD